MGTLPKGAYPNPCCRCGFCCLSETCPTGQVGFGVGKHDPCPALSFEGDFHVDPVTLAAVENPGRLAVCGLAVNASPELAAFFIGVGQGCCIKARAIAKGVTYDFAMLPPHIKKGLAHYVAHMAAEHYTAEVEEEALPPCPEGYSVRCGGKEA